MDLRKKAKEEVLQELMDMMEKLDGESLKSHSPKFAAMKLEVEPKDEMDAEGSPMEEMKDKLLGQEEIQEEDSSEDEELLKKLYAKLC